MKFKKQVLFNKWLVCMFLLPSLAAGDMLAQNSELHSPDGRLSILFETIVDNQTTEEGGQLVYSVTFQDQPLVDRSVLSLELQHQKPLGEEVTIISTETSSHDQSYELIAGKTRLVHDQYHALTIHLQENELPARKLIIEVRAYDDAIAFRYIIPEQSGIQEYRLTRERTEFKISKDAITYAQILPNFRHSYESEYIKLPISSFSHQGSVVNEVLIGLPLLMEVPGVAWLAINEADLQGYS
ncbi:MAG: glycoside hydrolase family 97 N-terminal domain-containing protein, partial [Bacteroidales bacterium]